MSEADRLNQILAESAPLVAQCLSGLGRRAAFPKGIPYQSAQAAGTTLNATMGQVTDGFGDPLALPELAGSVGDLDQKTCFLYSPQSGHRALRDAWAARQRSRSGQCQVVTSTPFVTHGLTQAVSIVAEMFADPDTPILVPAPFWENYHLLFGLRIGASITPVPLFSERAFNLEGLRSALARVSGQKAILVLNFPQNPTGYTPTTAEGEAIVSAIVAHPGPLVVLLDDAYEGMVYGDGLLGRSLFWDLLERTDPKRVLPIRADGTTKELFFYSARLGFITHGLNGAAEEALESKMKCLGRGCVGSPPGPSQALTLQALSAEGLEGSIHARLDLLRRRYSILEQRLLEVKSPLLSPFPFNSGSFALLQLSPSVSAESLRKRLIDFSAGVIAIPEVNAIRIAYCSMSEESIPLLVDRIEEALGEL